MLHDFGEALRQLTTAIEDKVPQKGIISFDEDVQKPFESTTAPANTYALQGLARLFEGAQSQSLFFRLDGPALYLLVSAVLQFPPCSLLRKTVYFFMDMLSLYADKQDARHALHDQFAGATLDKEIGRRQTYIFTQLVPRLKILLFEDGKHSRVRWLIAQLIVTLCRRNARGWQELMKAQEQSFIASGFVLRRLNYDRLLFGTLLSRTDDYTLRILITDIIRHLLANNFDFCDLWEQSSEQVLDFPTSLEIHHGSLSRMLDTISILDASQAFNKERTSRLYRITDIRIPDVQYHSARSDTIVTIDDNIVLLVPDQENDRTRFLLCEISITQDLALEVRQAPKDTSHLRMYWQSSQGHLVIRGKKKKVKEIHLRFAQPSDRDDFTGACHAAFERQGHLSRPTLSQQQTRTPERPPRALVNHMDFSDDVKDAPEGDRAGEVNRFSAKGKSNPISSKKHCTERASSDMIIRQTVPTSDVFSLRRDKDQVSGKSSTAFLQSVSIGAGTRDDIRSPEVLLSGDHSSVDLDTELSSPLKHFNGHNHKEEAAAQSHYVSDATNLALNIPLQRADDSDYASFLNTASRANVSDEHNRIMRNRNHQNPPQDPDADGREASPTATNNTNAGNIAQSFLRDDSVSEMAECARPLGGSAVTLPKPSKSIVSKNQARLLDLTSRRTSVVKHSSLSKQLVDSKTDPRSRNFKVSSIQRQTATTSVDVDWDEALRTNEHKTKRIKLKCTQMKAQLSKKPLETPTDTTQKLTAQSKIIEENKSYKRKFVLKKRATAPKSPSRKSERVAAKVTKPYVKPLASGDTSAPEDTFQDADSRDGVEGGKDPRSTALYTLATDKRKKARSTLFGNDMALANAEGSPARIEVLSSNREVGPNAETLKQTSRQKQLNQKSVTGNDTLMEDGIEFLDDSYPNANGLETAQPAKRDKSFGVKLNNMLTTTFSTSNTNDVNGGNPSFGDPKKFVYNVNSAKKSRTHPSTPTMKQPDHEVHAEHVMSTRPGNFANSTGSMESDPCYSANFIQKRPEDTASVQNHTTCGSYRIQPVPLTQEFELFVNPPGELSQQQKHLATNPEKGAVEMQDASKIPMNPKSDAIEASRSSSPGSKELKIQPNPEERVAKQVDQQDWEHEDSCKPEDAALPSAKFTIAYSTTGPILREASEASSASSPTRIDVPLVPPVEIKQRIPSKVSSRGQGVTPANRRGSSTGKSEVLSSTIDARYRPEAEQLPRRRTRQTKQPSARRKALTGEPGKIKIIRFGSTGPQNQGSPTRSSILDMPEVSRQHPPCHTAQAESLASNFDKTRTHISQHRVETTSSANDVDSPSSSRAVTKRSTRSPSVASSKVAKQSAISSGEVKPRDRSDLDTVSRPPMALSAPPESTAEGDALNRRSDHASRLDQTTEIPALSPIPAASRDHNEDAIDKDNCILQVHEGSLESIQPIAICISSAENISEAGDDTSSAMVQSQQTIHDTGNIPQFSNYMEIHKTQHSSNSVFRNSGRLQQRAEGSLCKPSDPRQASNNHKELNLTDRTIPFSEAMQTEHSPIFSLNPGAPRIFGIVNEPAIPNDSTFCGPGNHSRISQNIIMNDGLKHAITYQCNPIDKELISHNSVRMPRQESPFVVDGKPRPTTTYRTRESQELDRKGQEEHESSLLRGNVKIVRLRKQQDSPNEKSVAMSSVASTPQPFLQCLHAQNSPPMVEHFEEKSEHLFGNQKNSFEPNQTTLVDQTLFSPSGHPQPYSDASTPPTYPGSDKLVVEREKMSPRGNGQLYQGTSRFARTFASNMRRDLAVINQEIVTRIDAEEELARLEIERYRTRCLEVVNDLKQNANSRVDHNAMRFVSTLKAQQEVLIKAKLQLDKVHLHASRCNHTLGRLDQHQKDLLMMLDGVQV